MSETHFSRTYVEARHRFKAAAVAAGATITSYPIEAECHDELAIDVAVIGDEAAPTVVTSSGIHGVEGFFGSAVQHALLDQLRQSSFELNIRHLLIHGVNPFGFASLRRFNEDNVDLNRNFLSDNRAYKGAPDDYTRLNEFLNPESPPSRFEPFMLKALWQVCRRGLQPLKQAVAGGQYQYPRGIFFGGHGPSKSAQIVHDNCDRWIGPTDKIVHIDFHTGLGALGTYKLLLAEGEDSVAFPWYRDAFGADYVESRDVSEPTSYRVSGLFGEWLRKHVENREYRFVTAEFGTYGPIRVLRAIRAENRAHHFANETSGMYQAAKTELLECFCPACPSWRKQVVESGLEIITQAARSLRISQ